MSVSAHGVALTIGSGIFIILGEAAHHAGRFTWLAFLIAGTLAGLTAFSYAELSSMFPRSGSEYLYAHAAFPDPVAQLAMWTNVFILIVGSGLFSFGIAENLNQFHHINIRWGAGITLVVASLIVLTGLRSLNAWVVGSVVVQLVIMMLVVVASFFLPEHEEATTNPHMSGILAAAALVFLTYGGFDEVAAYSDDMHAPHKNVPRAIFIVLSVCTFVYVAFSHSVVKVLGVEGAESSVDPVSGTLVQFMGTAGRNLVLIGILFACGNSLLVALNGAATILHKWSLDTVQFTSLEKLDHRGIARPALFWVTLGAMSCVINGNIGRLAQSADFAIFILFAIVNMSVISLRRSKPRNVRPFRIAGQIFGLPLVPVLGLILSLTLITRISHQGLLDGTLSFIGGIIAIGLVSRKRTGRRSFAFVKTPAMELQATAGSESGRSDS